jgi:hypothetical protein
VQACARLCPTGLTEDRERPLTAEVARLQLPSQGLESGAFHVWGLYRFVSYGFTEIDGKTVTQPIWLAVKRSMRDNDDASMSSVEETVRIQFGPAIISATSPTAVATSCGDAPRGQSTASVCHRTWSGAGHTALARLGDCAETP